MKALSFATSSLYIYIYQLYGVVGFKLSRKLRNGVTSNILTVTQMLRKHGVVGFDPF